MEDKYIATGYVYGKYWGGGEGAYKSTKVEATTEEKLIEEATKMLDSGALDSGMGYESLLGAVLNIEHIKYIEKDGDIYSNSDYFSTTIGKLTEKQEEFLCEIY